MAAPASTGIGSLLRRDPRALAKATCSFRRFSLYRTGRISVEADQLALARVLSPARRRSHPHLSPVPGGMAKIVEDLVVDAAPGNSEHRRRQGEAGIVDVLLPAVDRQRRAHVAEHAQRVAIVERTAIDERFGPDLSADRRAIDRLGQVSDRSSSRWFACTRGASASTIAHPPAGASTDRSRRSPAQPRP